MTANESNMLRLLRMALRSCLVSCRDLAGTEHAVEVTAESLYEAVAQALGILRGDMWVEEIGEGLPWCHLPRPVLRHHRGELVVLPTADGLDRP